MINLTTRVIIICLLFFLLAGCRKEDVVPALAQHEKAYPEIKKKYVYQSLIRLANVKQDPDFEKLIKDVRKIILYLPPKEDSTYQIKDLRSGLRKEGFEQLIDIRTEDAQHISLLVKDSNSKAHYLALLDTEDDDIILEIDGQINLEYLSAIRMADQGSLKELLKGGFQ